jgi:transcriptional regulator with XRE-family HTH domain
MLNLTLVQHAMREQGLNLSGLAGKCGVSRGVASRWMAGESLPRPFKLKRLAEALGRPVTDLLLCGGPRPSCVAMRPTGTTSQLGPADWDAWTDTSWRLYELEPFVEPGPRFAPTTLAAPGLDAEYLRAAAEQAKASIGLAPDAVLSTEHLIALNRAAGTVLLPAPWRGDREGQGHLLRMEMSEQQGLWLVFGINQRCTELDAALGHALGLRYARHAMQGEEAETFARHFSQALCTPGVSRRSDPDWTVEQAYFGDCAPSMFDFVARCEAYFGTPAYRAMTAFQRYDGGRNPAFLASLLNIGLRPALELSYVLAGIPELPPSIAAKA